MPDYARVAVDTIARLQEAVDDADSLDEFCGVAASEVGDGLGLELVAFELFRQDRLIRIATWGAEPVDPAYLKWLADVRSRLHPGASYWDFRSADPSLHVYCLPLVHVNQAVGALLVGGAEAFGDDAVEGLAHLVRTAAHCCSLMSLREQLAIQTAEFLTIAEIGKALNTELDLKALLDTVAETTLKLTGADTACIAVTGGSGDVDCEVAVATGMEEARYAEDGLGPLSSIVREVSTTGMAVLVGDTDSIGSEAYEALSRRHGVRSLIAVPMHSKDRVLGVLVVHTGAQDGGFNSKHLDLATAVAEQAGVAMENARLYGEMQDLYVATIRSLAFTIEAKDKYTRGHSDRVTEYAVAIAERLGFDQQQVNTLRFAGILHDIGKIAVSEEILNKPGKLTPVEREIVQTHPAESARIIRPIGFLKDVVPIVEHHHEWYDGSGYGSGIAGEAIPLGARVLAVADAFEAMTSDRPYHSARPWPEAVAELKRCAGTQFDPSVVDAFVGMILESIELDETIQ